MQFGRAYSRAVGLGVCGVAIAIGAMAPFSDATTATLDLRGFGAAAGTEGSSSTTSADPGSPATGGTLAATVAWPRAAADLEPDDICVVVYDDGGGLVDGDDVVAAIPGRPAAARWTLAGLAGGRYTLSVAQCPSAAEDARRWVEPQYLGGAADAEAATWVEVADGGAVDVGTIVLHAAALETWPRSS